jgi:hypothetical protein
MRIFRQRGRSSGPPSIGFEIQFPVQAIVV